VKLLAIILAALLILAHPWLAVAILVVLVAACGSIGYAIVCSARGRSFPRLWRPA
jgi:hypothetical protein